MYEQSNMYDSIAPLTSLVSLIPPAPRVPSTPSQADMDLHVRIWDRQDDAERAARAAKQSEALRQHAARLAAIEQSHARTAAPPRRKVRKP